MAGTPAVPAQTWNVVEFLPGLQNGQFSSVPNEEPRMLRWLTEGYRDTYRLSGATRRRAGSGPSMVRLVMDPIAGNGDPVVIHATLITSPDPVVPS